MTTTLEQDIQLTELSVPGYAKVVRAQCPQVGLDSIICIHSTEMGPALGGTRIYPYAKFEDALYDVMRLAKGMTYKSAVSQCGWGGGKSVIIADPKRTKTPELLRAFGAAVEKLKGQYICAEDVGCTPEDMLSICEETSYAVGLPGRSGNPAPFTAWGTYRGIQAVLQKLYNNPSPEGRTIAIKGLGSVGSELVRTLFWAGANLVIADIDEEKTARIARSTGAKVVPVSEIHSVPCDVFAPCALGGSLSKTTIPQLRCKGIAGCANNQLVEDSDADLLQAQGILYAPDFLVNAGGLMNVSQEVAIEGYRPEVARSQVHQIFDQLLVIFDIAEQQNCSTHQAAISLCDYRLRYQIGRRIEKPCFA